MSPTKRLLRSLAANDVHALLLLLAVAGALRFTLLGDKPYDHDEAVHALMSFRLSEGQPYRYDPVFHGPFLYWSNALVYQLIGATDSSARLLPALFATALVMLVWLLRNELGRAGWRAAGAFMALSPTFTYYGRFLAHDNYCAAFTLLLVWLALGYARDPGPGRAFALGAVAGLFLSTKAVSFIHMGLFTIFFMLVLAFDSLAPAWPRTTLWRNAIEHTRTHKRHLMLVLAGATACYLALYTSFFTYWRGATGGIVATLDYWGGQQLEPRIPGPVYFYLPRLMLHEPAFWLACAGFLWVGRGRERPFDLFLAYWTLAAFVTYGFAQEKVPWLLMHVLTPMTLLAGRYVDHLWRRPPGRAWVVTLLAVMLVWSARETLWLTFRMPPAAAHLLTYMASSQALKDAAEKARDTVDVGGRVFVSGEAQWPLAWYLRDRNITYELPPDWWDIADLVLASPSDELQVSADAWRIEDRVLRTWWYPSYDDLLTRELISYLLFHESAQPAGEARFRFVTRRTHPMPRDFSNTVVPPSANPNAESPES